MNSGAFGWPAPRGYVLIVVLSVIWGLAFVAIKRADFGLSPVNLTPLRWLIVSAGFLVIYPWVIKPKLKFEIRDMPRLLLLAVTSVVIYHLALNTAEKQVDASLAGLLISLAPLTTVLLSSVVLHEKLWAKWSEWPQRGSVSQQSFYGETYGARNAWKKTPI